MLFKFIGCSPTKIEPFCDLFIFLSNDGYWLLFDRSVISFFFLN